MIRIVLDGAVEKRDVIKNRRVEVLRKPLIPNGCSRLFGLFRE